MINKIAITIQIACLDDASGIYNALIQNLVEIRDINNISKKQRTYLENHGFLRKEVDIKHYKELIKDPNIDIYVAKDNFGKIIGFASIHKNKSSIYDIRTTLDNLYVDDEKVKELLTLEEIKFTYLDQISILPEFKRKGVATAIFKKIIADLDIPIVAFIVEAPLANKASALWHEYNQFEIGATCDGVYKGKKFKWSIYIHWNN